HLRPESNRLCRHGGDNTIRCSLQQIPDERAANAEAQNHELVDAQVIHETKMVVRVGIPRPVDLKRPGRLAAIGVSQIRENAAILVLELLDRVERAGDQTGHPRVQCSARDEQQRKARTGLRIADSRGALLVEAHRGPRWPGLLSEHLRRCGHYRRSGARCQYVASVRIHDQHLLDHCWTIRPARLPVIVGFAPPWRRPPTLSYGCLGLRLDSLLCPSPLEVKLTWILSCKCGETPHPLALLPREPLAQYAAAEG